ncbi:hypothetical protein MCOR27_001521 [Pyricularia oryzae]|uniref:Uncharacterized protein n=1 Tax=Pyricularia grisea TaxID=148305 RepID=A0ABQ8NRI8_PYRGI|nr:hypothetical protein MCOR27_001521 [Pyricularia oryzae]KAI6301116.1 hypothetical protein MCOR33_003298 [Pyricularia grisea]KAI6522707.1 hypothetical protein MCOR16_007436 [Pyricularia oryzae]
MMASVELPELGLFYSNTPIAPNSLSSCYNPTRLHTKSPNAKQAQGTSQKGIKKSSDNGSRLMQPVTAHWSRILGIFAPAKSHQMQLFCVASRAGSVTTYAH